MGIEPTLSAWKAEVLPLNYARALNSLEGVGFEPTKTLSRQIYSLFPLATREPLLSYLYIFPNKIMLVNDMVRL